MNKLHALLATLFNQTERKGTANPHNIKGKLHYKTLNGEWKPCLYHKVSRKERLQG